MMTIAKDNQILIIGDHPAEIKTLSSFLEKAGYQIFVASDSKSALEISQKVLPALILLDVTLSGADGFQIYHCLQESIITKNIPVIFMTEADDSENIVKGLTLGAVDYFVKPVQKEQVINCVQFHMRLRLLMLKIQEQNRMFTDEIKYFNVTESQLVKLTQQLEQRLEEQASQLKLALQELQKTQQELLAHKEKLWQATLYDSLTGLPNRTWFMERLQPLIQLASRNHTLQYAVLSIDLDRFKVVNDSLGHLLGDELLKNVALRIQACLNNRGVVARVGGDEFIVLLEYIQSVEEATSVAEYIQEQFKLPFQLGDYEVFTGVSIGITFSTMGYHSPIDVLRDAGIAMSQAKQSGKGRYQVLTPERKTKAIARLQLENDLRQAIERQEFFLEYQPIYSLSTGQLKGFEALVRWHHPSRGRVSPDNFIPAAEEIGLIERIDSWVLQQAIRQLSDWRQKFPNHPCLVVNINLSAPHLKQAKLLKEIETLCNEMEIPGNCLKLEITESSFLEISTEEINTLQQLRAKGIGLCIDDFGTGYSSLSRLHSFPVDTIKVDRYFVQHLGTAAREAEIVHTIVNLAQSLGLDLVAEGIETTEQWQKLQELGYQFGQGYLFSKPLNTQVATELLSGCYTLA